MEEIDLYENYTTTSMLIEHDEQVLTEWTLGYFRAHMAPLLPKNKGARILEVGCGYGRNLKALQHIGYENAHGIDVSKEQIEYARDRLGITNVTHVDAVTFLSDAREEYDVILLLDVLEHLDLNYSIKLLRLIRGALKQGGVFLIQVPNAVSPLSPLRYGDLTHLRAYTTHSMEQHLRLGGFTEMRHLELSPHIHGLPSFVRSCLWTLFLKPCISAFMLIANANRFGGIYTANMLTVAYKRS